MLGKVRRTTQAGRGFVFVKSNEDGQDYFLHYTDLRGSRVDQLREGQEIEFEPDETDKGLRAREASCVSS